MRKSDLFKERGWGRMLEVPSPLYLQAAIYQLVEMQPRCVYYIQLDRSNDDPHQYQRATRYDLETDIYYTERKDHGVGIAGEKVARVFSFHRGRIHEAKLVAIRHQIADRDLGRLLLAFAEFLQLAHDDWWRHRILFHSFLDFIGTKQGTYQDGIRRALQRGIIDAALEQYQIQFDH